MAVDIPQHLRIPPLIESSPTEASDVPEPTTPPVDAGEETGQGNDVASASWRWAAGLVAGIEVILLLGIFAAYAGTIPPDVNEAHYLGKAKHFWQNNWCANDLFIASSNAHWLFYVSVGWLTKFFSLPLVAWIGRLSTWLLISAGWVYLVRGMTPRWGAAVLSGGMFVVLQHFCHLAGEWTIGGVEAKGFAFALVFFGLGRMVRGDWLTCWMWWGGACGFHVLVGGWVVVAGFLCWLRFGWQDASLKRCAVGLVVGGLLSMLGVVPGLLLGGGVDIDSQVQAQRIYVFERLSHHLVFSSFAGTRLAWFAACLCLWLMSLGLENRSREAKRFTGFVFGTLVIAFAGILLNQYVLLTGDLNRGAQWLRYYWFRASDVYVPAATAIGLATFLVGLLIHSPRRMTSWLAMILVVGMLSVSFWSAATNYRGDGRPRADQQSLYVDVSPRGTLQIYQDWVTICRWIDAHVEPEAVVLTPRAQQTFKWYAERAEVANWKDIPQDAPGLIEWQERFDDIYVTSQYENARGRVDLGLLVRTDAALADLAETYKADYLLVTRYQLYWRNQLGAPTRFPVVYPIEESATDSTNTESYNYFVLLKLRP